MSIYWKYVDSLDKILWKKLFSGNYKLHANASLKGDPIDKSNLSKIIED